MHLVFRMHTAVKSISIKISLGGLSIPLVFTHNAPKSKHIILNCCMRSYQSNIQLSCSKFRIWRAYEASITVWSSNGWIWRAPDWRSTFLRFFGTEDGGCIKVRNMQLVRALIKTVVPISVPTAGGISNFLGRPRAKWRRLKNSASSTIQNDPKSSS